MLSTMSPLARWTLKRHTTQITQLFYAFDDVTPGPMNVTLPRRQTLHFGIPSLDELADRSHIDDSIVQMSRNARHKLVKELLVGVNSVAGDRTNTARNVAFQKRYELFFGLTDGQLTLATSVSQSRVSMSLYAPRIHPV